MKNFVFGLIFLGSVQSFGQVCTEDLREEKAIAAASQVELVNMGEPALTVQVLPMNAQDFYFIRFSYSGVQHSWRVSVDDVACMVTEVGRR